MEVGLDVIVVLIVFVGFCIGSSILINIANKEIKKQAIEDKAITDHKRK